MAESQRRCPQHSVPGASYLEAWACPDDCPDFLDELERQIVESTVDGNYTRMSKAEDGQFYRQVFRNHEPIGEPVLFPLRKAKP